MGTEMHASAASPEVAWSWDNAAISQSGISGILQAPESSSLRISHFDILASHHTDVNELILALLAGLTSAHLANRREGSPTVVLSNRS